MTYILGISAYYHDSAACLLKDGEIVAAAQEERFTRIKADADFPIHGVNYCLREAGITLDQVDHTGFYEKPFHKFHRLLETYLSTAPWSYASFIQAMPIWMKEKFWMDSNIKKSLDHVHQQILYCEHHESHAASAFYPSPFQEAAILTVDGVGEWTTTSLGVGKDHELTLLQELQFPHSLGLLYSAFTSFTGFKVNSAEYKVMGLAPYGEPKYVDLILDKLIDIKRDGSFRLNTKYFGYVHGLRMTNNAFQRLIGGPARKPETEITQREFDLARSVQEVTEIVMMRLATHLHGLTGQRNLCLAGGVALNCVANGKLLRDGPFENIWIQPAAGDAGGALGVAQYIWHRYLGNERTAADKDAMKGAYLGPGYTQDEIDAALREAGITGIKHLSRDQLLDRTTDLMVAGKVLGWFQGRMEYGPRALGNRSIIADPRPAAMRDTVNVKIKFRETFRPFAPSVLGDHMTEYFDLRQPSPYMLLVGPVKPNPVPVEAVTHVDGSARVQSVDRDVNPLYYDLISAFHKKTGVPLILNTSFNIRGDSIVNTPEDAISTFLQTWMDGVVLGDVLILKDELPERLRAMELKPEQVKKLPKD